MGGKGLPDTQGDGYWIDYSVLLKCDARPAPPPKGSEGVDWAKDAGEGKRVVISRRDLVISVTNSGDFVDSWLRQHVIDAGLDAVGLAVEWNARTPRGERHRISLIQVSTRTHALLVQMSQLRPPKAPELLRQVLSDPVIRKVGGGSVLYDSVKLEKDWGLEVLGRINVCELAELLGYAGGAEPVSSNSKQGDVSAVAKSVLALDFKKPQQVVKSDWERDTLTEGQISVAAVEPWIARESLKYLESLTGVAYLGDEDPPAVALAQGRALARRKGKAGAWGDEGSEEGGEGGLEERRPEPDMVLYLPQVDIRPGGRCAYWVWRATRISDQHIQRYCDVELSVSTQSEGDVLVLSLWGRVENVQKAARLLRAVLARSQLDDQYMALGLSVPSFVDVRDKEKGDVYSTALVNTPEVDAWSFFPRVLTETFSGSSVSIGGKGERKDVERTTFFSQAVAAEQAADSILGTRRPFPIQGPLPAGMDPAIIWDMAGYQ